MTLLPRLSSLSILVVVGAAACGGKGGGKGGDTIGTRGGGGVSAAPAVTLADDVAELRRAAGEGEQQSTWPERITFLGWTAERRVAFRTLVCNPDELGGRGPYCELRVCTTGLDTIGGADDCEDAAQFELYGDPIDFDADQVTAAAESAIAALGPLSAGTPQRLDAVAVSTAGMGLSLRLLAGDTVLSPPAEEEGLGVTDAHVTYVVDSPDGGCRAALGLASMQGEYEGVRGRIPYPFAALECR